MKKIKVLLVGEPNVGKTSLINLLGNNYFKVSNFSGTTIEKNVASKNYKGYEIEFTDLPGIYSLDENSNTDIDFLVRTKIQKNNYDIILNVLSATMFERNLNLTMDLLEQKNKTILAINMIDELQQNSIDTKKLSDILNVDVVAISTKYKINIESVLKMIVKVHRQDLEENNFKYPQEYEEELETIESFLRYNSNYLTEKSLDLALDYLGVKNSAFKYRYFALKLLQEDEQIIEVFSSLRYYKELSKLLDETRERVYEKYATKDLIYLKKELKQSLAHSLFFQTTSNFKPKATLTNRIDQVLLNNVGGLAIFFFIMWLIFEATFYLGSIPMPYIENGFTYLGELISPFIDSKNLKTLIVDAIIPGISAVIMFLPNILVLFLGITILETTGYLTRISFLLDGVLQKFGMHGRAIVPLIIGFGCTVPAYMATKMLESKKDKLITLFILGFVSCSAKLPVYVLFISAFFEPAVAGSVLFGVYMFGIFIALMSASFLNKTIFKSSPEDYMMEMPNYRLPSLRLIYMSIWLKTISYVKKAGIYITLISVVIWFTSAYPKYENQNEYTQLEQLENSYLGEFGNALEPVFAPLGFDWKMSISLLSGIAAKEVIVSTLSVLYVVENSDNEALITKLRSNIDFASAVSFIVFISLYLPCFAATVVFTKESGSARYLFLLVAFTFSISWLASFGTYNILRYFE